VRARQHADLDGDRADGARVTAIDARLAVEDALAHDVALEPEERALDRFGGPFRRLAAGKRGEQLRLDLTEARVTLLFLGDAVSLGERGVRVELHRGAELRFLGRRLPVPARLARFARELADRADRDLHLLVPKNHRAQHDLFG